MTSLKYRVGDTVIVKYSPNLRVTEINHEWRTVTLSKKPKRIVGAKFQYINYHYDYEDMEGLIKQGIFTIQPDISYELPEDLFEI